MCEESNSIIFSSQENRPPTNEHIAKELVQRKYNLMVKHVKELNGYDDRNYLVSVSNFNDNNNQNFILKITNSLESLSTDVIDLTNDILLHLYNNKVVVPIPVENTDSKLVSYEKFKSEKNDDAVFAVRLFTFLEGKILYNVQYTAPLLYECGVLLADLNTALETFKPNDAIYKKNTIWSLRNAPHVKQYLWALDDNDKKVMVSNILDQFDDCVISQLKHFDRGIIHGDFNEQNIMVQQDVDSNWHVSGVIDFGDIDFAPKIFDLAILATYAMLECNFIDPIMAPAFTISGYTSKRCIKDNEFNIIPICIKARLCVSLVMGAYAHRQNPTNTYALTTAKNGWTILERLFNYDHNELMLQWKDITKDNTVIPKYKS